MVRKETQRASVAGGNKDDADLVQSLTERMNLLTKNVRSVLQSRTGRRIEDDSGIDEGRRLVEETMVGVADLKKNPFSSFSFFNVNVGTKKTSKEFPLLVPTPKLKTASASVLDIKTHKNKT